jgi:DNA methylase
MLKRANIEDLPTSPSPLSVTAILNQGLPVHDWYLMPESYSEPLIVEALEKHGLGRGDTILDPFSGTGTTVVTAAMRGVNGVGLEVNPFLAFVSRVKLDWQVDLSAFKQAMDAVVAEAQPLLDSISVEHDLFTISLHPSVEKQAREILRGLYEPEMPRLYKWITEVVVQKVLLLEYVIRQRVPERLVPHFLVALASILRPISNMKLTAHAFGSNARKEDSPVFELFAQKIQKMYQDLEYMQSLRTEFGKSAIFNTDSRAFQSAQAPLLPASLAFTSPPYLNNLDYTMQTRLELFFLRFVSNMTELRQLRKGMVTCDAKAMYKDIKDSDEVADVASIKRIVADLKAAHQDKNWGWDYSFMTSQYFGGMLRVLKSMRALLRPGARFVLIVGESAHSGIKVPVPELLGELGERVSYDCEAINTLRSRRSSSHAFDLRECEVILRRE